MTRVLLPRLRPERSPLFTSFHCRKRSYATQQQTVPLSYESFGDDAAKSSGGALVMLHGLYGSKQNYRSIAKALTSKLGRAVYSVDLRNHGNSPHARPMDYATMAQDVAAFFQEHNLSKPILFGHSMGGKVAMALALAQPHLLSAVVSADMSPAKGAISNDFSNYMDAMKSIRDKLSSGDISQRKQADAHLASIESNIGVRQFLLTNLSTADEDKSKLAWRIALDCIAPELDQGSIGDFPYDASEAGHPTFDAPSLFIKGSKSKYINHKNEPAIKAFFPKSELVTLEAGHWVHAEAPKAFQEALLDFCARVPVSS